MSDGNLQAKGRAYKRGMTDEEKRLAAAVGRRLKWVRDLTGRTQGEMLPGRSHGEYSRWENGKRALPLLDAIELCNRFRISLDYIYRGHLLGVHPELAKMLWEQHPKELVMPPIYTGWGKGMDLA